MGLSALCGLIYVAYASGSYFAVRQSAEKDIGVWLAPNDDPKAIARDFGMLPLIALDFTNFNHRPGE